MTRAAGSGTVCCSRVPAAAAAEAERRVAAGRAPHRSQPCAVAVRHTDGALRPRPPQGGFDLDVASGASTPRLPQPPWPCLLSCAVHCRRFATATSSSSLLLPFLFRRRRCFCCAVCERAVSGARAAAAGQRQHCDVLQQGARRGCARDGLRRVGGGRGARPRAGGARTRRVLNFEIKTPFIAFVPPLVTPSSSASHTQLCTAACRALFLARRCADCADKISLFSLSLSLSLSLVSF